jgi:hypothetical protein
MTLDQVTLADLVRRPAEARSQGRGVDLEPGA